MNRTGGGSKKKKGRRAESRRKEKRSVVNSAGAETVHAAAGGGRGGKKARGTTLINNPSSTMSYSWISSRLSQRQKRERFDASFSSSEGVVGQAKQTSSRAISDCNRTAPTRQTKQNNGWMGVLFELGGGRGCGRQGLIGAGNAVGLVVVPDAKIVEISDDEDESPPPFERRLIGKRSRRLVDHCCGYFSCSLKGGEGDEWIGEGDDGEETRMDMRRRQERDLQREASSPLASADGAAPGGGGLGLVSLEISGSVSHGGGLDRSRSSRRRSGKLALRLRRTWLFLIFLVVFCFSILQWLLSFPPPLHKRPLTNVCPSGTGGDTPYLLYDDAVCSRACGNQCFPRVRRMCISHSEVTICEREGGFGGGRGGGGRGKTQTSVPSHLRFSGGEPGKRMRVSVKRKFCSSDSIRKRKWITGTQMVADMKMMPAGPHVGPNPHHEAEKIIPAILLSHLYGLNNSALYWFTDPTPSATSRWSLGLLDAFTDGLQVKFLDVPGIDQPEMCFEDAILFSGVTNAGYMPSIAANDWLRRRVLAHCKIPEMNARRPVKDVVILHRNNSSRTIANVDEIERVLERELRVPVKHSISGLGNFCEQAKVVAEADFFVTPHGSHNVNFLFARPESIVMEAFPLIYYIDWFHNYVHASRVNHYELYGTWPTEQGGMPLRMRIYALLVGWRYCFSFRQCMNYSKSQKIYVDVDQLEWLLHALITSCRVAVKGSWCLSAGGIQNVALVL